MDWVSCHNFNIAQNFMITLAMDLKVMMNGKNIFQFHRVLVASLTMAIIWTANDQVRSIKMYL